MIMKSPFRDPFEIKRLSKVHPGRIAYTAFARYAEWNSKRCFSSYAIPMKPPLAASDCFPDYEQGDTAVTPGQMAALLAGVSETDALEQPIVEIGSYRGVTTRLMADRTQRMVFAVDPYFGYGGADGDLLEFRKRTQVCRNVVHLRETSGVASRNALLATISFVFVDAVHDYVNVRFDGATWSRKLAPGGMIAFHDTDAEGFPGVMRAVSEILKEADGGLSLHFHVPGVVILKRS